ncbi:MAG: hypothetical protein ACNA7W_16455 [Pseudomonadales bacterium]
MKSIPSLLSAPLLGLSMLAATLVTTAMPSHGFGGALAIGMSQLSEEGELAVSFKATARFEADEHAIEETLYYQAGKLREEMNVGGNDMVIIQRHDLGKLWVVMPQGFYMETAIDAPNEQVKSFSLVEHERLGSETINGIATTKYKTVWETDDGRFGGYSWMTDDNIAVKADLVSESEGEQHHIRYEMTQLERISHADSLFEVPEGHSRMNIPSMGDLFGGGRQAYDEDDESMNKRIRDGVRGLLKR